MDKAASQHLPTHTQQLAIYITLEPCAGDAIKSFQVTSHNLSTNPELSSPLSTHQSPRFHHAALASREPLASPSSLSLWRQKMPHASECVFYHVLSMISVFTLRSGMVRMVTVQKHKQSRWCLHLSSTHWFFRSVFQFLAQSLTQCLRCMFQLRLSRSGNVRCRPRPNSHRETIASSATGSVWLNDVEWVI